jgi:hypothetical protein
VQSRPAIQLAEKLGFGGATWLWVAQLGLDGAAWLWVAQLGLDGAVWFGVAQRFQRCDKDFLSSRALATEASKASFQQTL